MKNRLYNNIIRAMKKQILQKKTQISYNKDNISSNQGL